MILLLLVLPSMNIYVVCNFLIYLIILLLSYVLVVVMV